MALLLCLSGCAGGSGPKQAAADSAEEALVGSGMVSGKFRGNTATSYLSFSATISGFKEDGMTCVVTPVYKTAE